MIDGGNLLYQFQTNQNSNITTVVSVTPGFESHLDGLTPLDLNAWQQFVAGPIFITIQTVYALSCVVIMFYAAYKLYLFNVIFGKMPASLPQMILWIEIVSELGSHSPQFLIHLLKRGSFLLWLILGGL